jgi:hypothetical protein
MFELKIVDCKKMRINDQGKDRFGFPWGVGTKVYRIDIEIANKRQTYRERADSAKKAKVIAKDKAERAFAWLWDAKLSLQNSFTKKVRTGF